MEKFFTSNLKLGIIAGGQLGKMLIQEASKWDISSYVLDPDESCPAGGIASGFQKGSYTDFDAVYEFGKQVDLLTFEIEHVNTGALRKLQSEGLRIIPDPSVLELIQDKGLQKVFYSDHGMPTSPFRLFESRDEILDSIAAGSLKFPFVQKLRRGGYDGRGVAVIDGPGNTGAIMEGPSLVEDKVKIEKEIAVIAVRNQDGEVRCFPPVEMVFDSSANLVERIVCPPVISEGIYTEAERLAARLTETMNMAGALAVEFFVDNKGQILVNEMAPRPHNSGHHTIESMMTSQFEQHLRAVLGLPLGSTMLKMPSVMINILGEPGYEGPVKYEGLTEAMAIEGVNVHLYGKKITRPYRKMGHVTVISKDAGDAALKADLVQNIIKVKSWK